MEDPLSALLKSLQTVFLTEAVRNGRYTYPAVQQLKEATEFYNSEDQNTFAILLTAIKEAMPRIEKCRVNFDSIRKSMNALAKQHQTGSIDWTNVISHPKVSPRFQFSALNHSKKEADLPTWIAKKTGKPFFQLESAELTQFLIKNRDTHGFSQKLSTYLKKNPDFLYHLIIEDAKNFGKICHSRLILYLTDQQIAKAIIKHLPTFVHKKNGEPYEQVDQVVNTLNEILSNGRSISTLLRNAEAKPILFNSIFFQLYQSEGYVNRQTELAPAREYDTALPVKPV